MLTNSRCVLVILAIAIAPAVEPLVAELGEADPKSVRAVMLIRGGATEGPATQLDRIVLDASGTWKP